MVLVIFARVEEFSRGNADANVLRFRYDIRMKFPICLFFASGIHAVDPSFYFDTKSLESESFDRVEWRDGN